jgi:hypothetical protein
METPSIAGIPSLREIVATETLRFDVLKFPRRPSEYALVGRGACDDQVGLLIEIGETHERSLRRCLKMTAVVESDRADRP